jgi:hypothetical protein
LAVFIKKVDFHSLFGSSRKEKVSLKPVSQEKREHNGDGSVQQGMVDS